MVGDETNAEGAVLTPDAESVETPEAAADKQPQAVPEVKVPTVEELQKALTEKDAKITGLETNYKAMQRNLEQARRAGTLDPESKKILEELQEHQALILDEIDLLKEGRDTEETLIPKEAPQRKSRYAELKEQKSKQGTEAQRRFNAMREISEVMKSSGLDSETAGAATEVAGYAFQKGNYEEAVQLFKQGIARVAPKKAAAAPQFTEKDIEERANLRALKILKDQGLFDVDLGGSSSSLSGSDNEFLKKYGSPDFNPSAADHKRAAELNQKIIKGG